jgi:hypothetical protein
MYIRTSAPLLFPSGKTTNPFACSKTLISLTMSVLLLLLSLLQTKRKQTEKKCEMIHPIRVIASTASHENRRIIA